MPTNEDLEEIAASTKVSLTLAHWDKEKHNTEWVSSGSGQVAFMKQIQSVAKVAGTQAQGKGLYLLDRPDRYSPKAGSDNLMIVQCTNTPCLDARVNPKPGSDLYNDGFTSLNAIFQQEEHDEPPRMLMQYGNGHYYRLTTIEGVFLSTSLADLDTDVLEDWRKKLWQLSDKTGFNAFKAQAEHDGIDVSKW